LKIRVAFTGIGTVPSPIDPLVPPPVIPSDEPTMDTLTVPVAVACVGAVPTGRAELAAALAGAA